LTLFGRGTLNMYEDILEYLGYGVKVHV